MYNFDPYNVLLVIATNIPVLLMTASVLAGTQMDKTSHQAMLHLVQSVE